MANIITRMFTPSDSDGSGMVAPQAPKAAAKRPEPETSGTAKAKTITRFAGGAARKRREDESNVAKKTLLGA